MKNAPPAREGLELLWYTTPEGNPALIFEAAHMKIARTAAKKPPALSALDLILGTLTHLIKSNSVSAALDTPQLNFEWLTGKDQPETILIFAKETLPTIVALWQQAAQEVQQIIAKELMPTLYVNSLK